MFRTFSPARFLILVVGLATFSCEVDQTQAQLIPALKTRRFESAYQYAPSDPWTRSKWIQVQTKHYGFFYNCDGEECKRNSPYINWKSHCETDLPPKKGCLDLLKSEIEEIKQRISDGGCGCSEPGCDCK
jgi:hypothetical protein